MTNTTTRYSVKPLSRRNAKDQAAYVNDAEKGDVARCFTGPKAIAEAEAYAEQMNKEGQR